MERGTIVRFTPFGAKRHPGNIVTAQKGNEGFEVARSPMPCNCYSRGIGHAAVCASQVVGIDVGYDIVDVQLTHIEKVRREFVPAPSQLSASL